ncbi:MAG: dTDP-glucose 4,6-dehydratase [Candidatus Pacebacteria bacterium]|nr:dTDP-glucose 4,6-dehydratase [Candidatus Paceibacterota bacterium]
MSQTNQTLLVTGGAGFIGSNFIHYWLENHPEDKIINLDVLTYAGNLDNLAAISDNPNYVFVEGNITNAQLVDKIMDDVDLVVHFAAESHVDRSIKNPQLFLESNVFGTHTLLDSALKNEIKRFHHISTDEVFGALPLQSDTKFNEETCYDPRSPYSASKAASDHLVRAYGETYGLPFTITNCSNNYGPYQFPEKFFGLSITNLIEGKSIPIYGDGKYVRDWLFVKDHCQAVEAVLENGKLGETYLVGGMTKDISNAKIAQMIVDLMQDKGKLNISADRAIEYIKDRPGHDRRYAVDWSKINQKLGWKPSVTLAEGLEKTIDWYLANPDWWQPLKERNQTWFKEQYE